MFIDLLIFTTFSIGVNALSYAFYRSSLNKTETNLSPSNNLKEYNNSATQTDFISNNTTPTPSVIDHSVSYWTAPVNGNLSPLNELTSHSRLITPRSIESHIDFITRMRESLDLDTTTITGNTSPSHLSITPINSPSHVLDISINNSPINLLDNISISSNNSTTLLNNVTSPISLNQPVITNNEWLIKSIISDLPTDVITITNVDRLVTDYLFFSELHGVVDSSALVTEIINKLNLIT